MIDEIRAEIVRASSPEEAHRAIRTNDAYSPQTQLKPGYRVRDVLDALQTLQEGLENGRYTPDEGAELRPAQKDAIQKDLSKFMGDGGLWLNAGLLLARQRPQLRAYIEQLNTTQHTHP